MFVFRDEIDFAVKLFDDQLADDESQPNALGVDLFLLVLDRPKQFKELALILLFDSHA